MSNMSKFAAKLQKAITESEKKKTRPYDSQAKVLRVEDDTIWVHIAGGVDETPIKKTINAVPGDIVQVHIENGSAWVVGNSSVPPTGDARANEAYVRAEVAALAADNAVEDADRAREAADLAVETAKSVEGIAKDAQTNAGIAKTAADTAFTNLAQVQSVLEVAEWIATHGTYTKATTFNPNTTYYTLTATQVADPSDEDKDSEGVLIYYELSNGVYVRTTDTEVDTQKTYYTVTGTPVAGAKAEDIGQYYTLAVTDAMANYIKSHLAVTNDGLYVMADDSDWKVLITNNGVYIINPEGENVAKYKDTITIGKDDGSEGAQMLDYHSLQLFDQENMTMIAQGDIENAKPYFYVSDLRPRSQHIIFSNVISDGIRSSYYSDTRGEFYRINIPNTSNIRLFTPTEDRIDFEYSMDGVLYKANNKDFKFYKDARCVRTRNSSAGRYYYDVGIRVDFYDKLIEGDTYVIKYYTNEKSFYDFTTEYEISHTVTADEANTYSLYIYHPAPLSSGWLQLKSISYNGALLFGLQRTSSGVLLIAFDSVFGTSSTDMRSHYSLCTADFDIYSTKLKALTFGNRQKNSVLGSYSVSIGENNVSAGKNSLVMGDNARGFGDNSIVIGDNVGSSYSNSLYISNKDQTLHNPSIRMAAYNDSAKGDIIIRFPVGYESDITSIEDVDDFSETYRSDIRRSQDRLFRLIMYNKALSYEQYKGTVECIDCDYYPDGSDHVKNDLYIYKGVKMGSSADDRETYIGVRTRSSSSFTGGALLAALDNKDLYIKGETYQGVTSLSLGTYVASAILTSSGGNLSFSIPTGRTFPPNTTISKITFNMAARASNSNGAGYYITKATSAGGGADFDSSTSKTFYNANNVQKTVTSSMWTKNIQGNTNIYITIAGGTDFFSGTSTIRGYINNNAVVVLLTNIQVTLSNPFPT